MAHQAGDGIGRGSGRGAMRCVEASLPLLARQPLHGHQLSKCLKRRIADTRHSPGYLDGLPRSCRSSSEGAVGSVWGPGKAPAERFMG